jgi:UDP-2-acetamido-3-amino-2,3-dideoxy-glucuronate N-acetyltransferase
VTETRIHPNAVVEDGVAIGRGTQIWDGVHIRGPGTKVGDDCIIGEKTYVAYGVEIGNRVKVNAFVYVCAGVTVEDGVMAAAGVIFTNDRYPRATTPDLTALLSSDIGPQTCRTVVRRGATLGAGARIGPGVEIGQFALVGMGAVVTSAVAPFNAVVGSPARVVSVVCRCAQPVAPARDGRVPDLDIAVCPACGRRYAIAGGVVSELDGVP